MADVVFIAVIVGFFAVLFAFVRACEWLLASSESEPADLTGDADDEAAGGIGTAEVAA